jgi:hypothetical protein
LTDEVRQYARESIEKLIKQKQELEIIEMDVQPDARSPDNVDTAKAFGGERDGIFEREISHPHFAKI